MQFIICVAPCCPKDSLVPYKESVPPGPSFARNGCPDAFSHKIDYVKKCLHDWFKSDGNFAEWVLIGEVASGRVCACSLRSRLVTLVQVVNQIVLLAVTCLGGPTALASRGSRGFLTGWAFS